MTPTSHFTLASIITVLFASGCGGGGSNSEVVSLKFAAKVGEQDAACGRTYNGLGSRNSNVVVNGIRFFVSNIRLLDSTGDEHPVELDQDGIWQYQDTALLDFENATSGCSEVGTAETNTTLRGKADISDVSGVRFDLGIPFDLNHLDPTSSPSPLNISAMNWFWQVGHILFRTDLKADGKPWFIHLGSSGCVSDAFTSAPSSPCSNPNVPTITLTNYSVDKTIVLDVASLLQGVDLTKSTPNTAPGCMSERADNECSEIFPNFGLSLATGKCEESCSNQSAFYVR
jgi:uncharacterized repeat protein (TIGR04052 family)